MSKLIMLALGGSGERVMNSTVMLLAAGMRLKDCNDADLDLVPVFLDTDDESNALASAQLKIQEYQKLYKLFRGSKDTFGNSTLFRTKIEDAVEITIDGTTMGSLAALVDKNRFDDDKKAELDMLYTEAAQNVGLGMGFIGMPNLGTVALNFLLCTSEFKSITDGLQDGDYVFFVSSIFGGTGAAGFPLILNKLQALNIIKKTDNKISVGSVTLLPYFDFSSEATMGLETKDGFSIDATEFNPKTYAAFMYYDNNLNKERVSSQYFIGNTDKSLYRKELGGGFQNNPANLIEVACATSLFHFAENSAPRDQNNKNISYYEYWSGKEDGHEYDLNDIDDLDVKTALVRFQMFEYIMKKALKEYTERNKEVIADHYDFNVTNCNTLTKKFDTFFNLYDTWREELNGSEHRASIQFQYYNREPSNNEFITECFNPSIATIHKEGTFVKKDVISEPDFLKKMSDSLGNKAGRGWNYDKKEWFTLYLIMSAIEKVLTQKNPYQIVQL